ncbi:MAG: protein translocase subunit SecF [Candidatus Nanopelagicales bacterium]
MSGRIGIAQRLYKGQVSFNFVGRRRTWYVISAIILLVSVGALLFRGLNLGIEFRGGADFSIPNATCSIEQARAVAESKTGSQAIVTSAVNGTIRVQTESLTADESSVLAGELANTCGVPKGEIKVQVVGPTWGSEISKKALQALVVFLLLVSIFLSIYFEWRMAIAALVALAHDLVITIGIYALTGLEVTPATVIGLLTILGFSLYDTVVVFDKVKENTRNISGQSVMTYSEAANLALNQTLVRSINTSIVALLPVLAIIIIGAGLLGAGTLLDLAVALAVGMAAGTYSSIFIATPFLAQLKEHQPEMRSLSTRVNARRTQAGKNRTGEAEGENVVGAGEVTTLLDGAPRQQPKRVSRSRRSKS